MDMFPMPELQRSVAISTESLHIKIHSLAEIEQVVNSYINDKDYSSATYVMDTVDGLKSKRKMSLDEDRIKKERNDIEKDELEYVRAYGIEKYICYYNNVTCLRNERFINAQLNFLASN